MPTRRQRINPISVAHPDINRLGQVLKQQRRFKLDRRGTVLTGLCASHSSPNRMSEQLHSIANAENGQPTRQNLTGESRRIDIIASVRPSANEQNARFEATELL